MTGITLKGINKQQTLSVNVKILLENNKGYAFRPIEIRDLLKANENNTRASLLRLFNNKEINKFSVRKNISFYFSF